MWHAVLRVLTWLAIWAGAAVVLSATGVAPAELSHGVALASGLSAGVLLAGVLLPATDRRWLRVTLLVIVELSLLILIAPDIGALLDARQNPGVATRGRLVSIVELNVWDLNPDRARAIAWLRRTNADILVLAEVSEPFVSDLISALPDYPTRITCAARAYCGVFILSRFPGRAVAGGRLVSDGLGHASGRDPAMALAAAELRIPGDGGEVAVPIIGVHLDRRGFSRVEQTQIDDLLAITRQAAGKHRATAVVAGDFNASPWSPQLRRFGEQLGVRRATVFAPTWPGGGLLGGRIPAPPFLGIDHVYLGCGWQPALADVGLNVASDHRPLLVSLVLARSTPECKPS